MNRLLLKNKTQFCCLVLLQHSAEYLAQSLSGSRDTEISDLHAHVADLQAKVIFVAS